MLQDGTRGEKRREKNRPGETDQDCPRMSVVAGANIGELRWRTRLGGISQESSVN
jgi:hypothetical protein